MSDRTALSLIIYKANDTEGCLDIIQRYGLSDEWSMAGPNPDAGDDLRIGDAWVDAEAHVGAAPEIAGELIALGDVWFKVHEDPKYEWLGVLVMFTPELGRYDASCDSTGEPVFTGREVRDILGLPAAIEDRLGQPWLDAFEAME